MPLMPVGTDKQVGIGGPVLTRRSARTVVISRAAAVRMQWDGPANCQASTPTPVAPE